MSFFDEANNPRTASRPAPRRRAAARGASRPPADPQVIRTRRMVALLGLVAAIVLLGVLVHSCQVDQRNGALKDYNANVVAIMQQSDATGRQVFSVLTSGAGPRSAYTSLNQARNTADGELSHARGFGVPDGLQQAQQHLVLALQMRRDGIGAVAANIEQALGTATSRDAAMAIAANMARFYASDVLYKDYALPLVVGALRADHLAVGGLNGQPVYSGQFLPDLRWLDPTFVASELRTSAATSPSKSVAPGSHGHALNSVSTDSLPLQAGANNKLSPGAAPVFRLNFTNTGQNTETNVLCKVTLTPSSGGASSLSGQTVVPQTTAGQQNSCNVQLSSAPSAGSYTLAAMIAPVAGEHDTANNTLSFPVTVP